MLLLECWKLWNGQIGPATQATSASVSSHWLSRTGSLPSAPSHVPPAAPPPVAAAAGGLTGVGGGADMVDDNRTLFARSTELITDVFVALAFLRLHGHTLLSGALLQPLCSLPSHFSHSPTHFHSQLEFPIKTKSLHIFRAGARPLCKSGPLIAPPTTLMVWAGSPP